MKRKTALPIIGDGIVISRGDKSYDLPEYDERNPVLTGLRASTLKEEGVQDVKSCSYVFFLNGVLGLQKGLQGGGLYLRFHKAREVRAGTTAVSNK